MKQKITVNGILPQRLKEAIDKLELSRINTGKCLKLACLILQKQRLENHNTEHFVPMPSKYLERIFTKKYHRQFFNLLRQAGILEDNGQCRRGTAFKKGVANAYRINSKYQEGDFVNISYEDKMTRDTKDVLLESIRYSRYFFSSYSSPGTSHSLLPGSTSRSLAYNNPPFPKKLIYDDLGSLFYDEAKLWSMTGQMIASINDACFKTGCGVDGNFFQVTNNIRGFSYYVTKTKTVEWAQRNGCTLIQDGRYYYLDDLERYVALKKKNILLHYRWYMKKLASGQFYAERNERNNRLDHNLTSLPKLALEIIKRDNDLVELDLSNSQFAIHAHWLRREGLDKEYQDVQLYCEICASGRLYELLADMLGITREEAKQLMMELAFSRQGNNTKAKELFRSRFPHVVAHIDGFKEDKTKDPRYKKNGYKEFAVELQKREAEMFVDNLYPNIKELGLFCLTKHDSLLFRRKDRDVVMAIVKEYFNHLGFRAAYKVE